MKNFQITKAIGGYVVRNYSLGASLEAEQNERVFFGLDEVLGYVRSEFEPAPYRHMTPEPSDAPEAATAAGQTTLSEALERFNAIEPASTDAPSQEAAPEEPTPFPSTATLYPIPPGDVLRDPVKQEEPA